MATPKKKPDVFDLDAHVKKAAQAARKQQKWNEMSFGGEVYRVTTEPNVFTALAAATGDDSEAVLEMLLGSIHPDDVERFSKALYKYNPLTGEVLLAIVEGVLEAGTEHPTTSPSSSSTSSRTKAATRK